MYKNKKIAVVVPCYNEETQIGIVIDTMPEFVDKIIIIDDVSTDKTVEIVKKYLEKQKDRIVLICHEKNKGVGAAISTGYIWCRDNGIDISAVMAGDAQMDPNDLTELLDPVAEDRADYSKGNRLITGEAWQKIPKVRYFGNTSLTLMTKVASGYWHVTDSQSGYTAINKKALKLLPLKDIFPRYGMPNDFLVTLNIYDMRVMDVPINPLYGVGERSKMVIHRTIPVLFLLMTKLFLKRMAWKYIIRDFHPLIFFYLTGFMLGLISIPLVGKLIYSLTVKGMITPISLFATGFTIVMSLQFLFFAMWFDMDYNRHLNPHR
ncbi:MAG: ribonuclease BN [Lentisphaerae bacterium GWF2_44_16]|nr:MAG: ribonuclease BN [Lentisphaerae bacterium GWF2_44_16]